MHLNENILFNRIYADADTTFYKVFKTYRF
jgi:hypothetical protein